MSPKQKVRQVEIRHKKGQMGFSLIELLVALVISTIVMTAVYTTFASQQKAYVAQDQIAEMHQNLRACLYLIQREIRLAGHDPSGVAGAQIMEADANSIHLTMDIRGATFGSNPDGDVGDQDEDITYSLFDCNGDGIMDLRRADPTLVPANAGTPVEQMLAENIDALDFVYLDKDGIPTATTAEIRSVQITLVARVSRKDSSFTDTTVYKNRMGTTIYIPSGDAVHYRRQLVNTQVKSRNLGL
jgi:type IV pilus assembly protein PilW